MPVSRGTPICPLHRPLDADSLTPLRRRVDIAAALADDRARGCGIAGHLHRSRRAAPEDLPRPRAAGPRLDARDRRDRPAARGRSAGARLGGSDRGRAGCRLAHQRRAGRADHSRLVLERGGAAGRPVRPRAVHALGSPADHPRPFIPGLGARRLRATRSRNRCRGRRPDHLGPPDGHDEQRPHRHRQRLRQLRRAGLFRGLHAQRRAGRRDRREPVGRVPRRRRRHAGDDRLDRHRNGRRMSLPASAPGPSWQERGRILRPRLPAFWLFAFLVTIGALGAGGIIAGRVSAAPSSSLFAITLLVVWGVPLVYVIHALDLADRWGAAIAGPIDEETLKALGLLLLVLIAAAEIDTPIDGLVYGAFIGLGFQIVEDFTYLTNPAFSGDGFSQTHVVWELFVVRGLVAGIWSHAAYTGLVGLGIGFLVSRPDVSRAWRITLAILAFAGAWAMHFVWNSPWLENVLAGGFWRTIIAQSVIKGLPGFLLLAWLYFRARRREARWVEHVLMPETATGAVTPAEIEALLTFHGRRRERRAARRLAGRRAARR